MARNELHCRWSLVTCVVMSPMKVLTPLMGFMGTRSTPRISEVMGSALAQTCQGRQSNLHFKVVSNKVLADGWVMGTEFTPKMSEVHHRGHVSTHVH